ncbi:MerR family transcriptional regulator [Saccharopolyspora sp. MS10]|uniref:MerR family transcriptional regulator n=1 Tax=Saccharopolyspora sp. MS10 TaxID=3385973 RepID=UPI0039A2D0B4
MRIGELSRRTGVSPRSPRYYEEQGLLGSSRSGTGQRLCTEAEVQRVFLLRQLFDAGLSSRVIALVLPCVTAPDEPGVVEEAWATMVRERDRLDADIARLVEVRAALDALISANRHHGARTSPEPVARDLTSWPAPQPVAPDTDVSGEDGGGSGTAGPVTREVARGWGRRGVSAGMAVPRCRSSSIVPIPSPSAVRC